MSSPLPGPRSIDPSAPESGAPEGDGHRQSREWAPPGGAPRGSRGSLYVAGFIVAVISAGALFLSGYTLGTQRALTPGTTVDNQQLFGPYWEAYNKIVNSYVGDFEPKALVEGSIKGMFEALHDPFSAYMTSDEYKASLSGISGQFEGIGAEMAALNASGQTCTPLAATCNLTVLRVIRNSPAERAGLLAADIVSGIDGTSTAGLALDDAVAKIRGQRNTDVTLSLIRGTAAVELTITRDVVETEEVTTASLEGGSVIQLKIAGFSSSAAADFKKLLKQHVDAGVKRFVLDLRDDPGGFVGAALSIADEFIASGPIYWDEDAMGHDVPHGATGSGVATDPSIGLVVLVNGGTASASEIVTGALRDTGRATIVGTKTYGKGTIQQWILLSNDSGGFRLSTAKWLTPDKIWIHGVGITPDVVVEKPDGLAPGEDPQLDRALAVLAAMPSSGGSAAGPGSSPAPDPTPEPAGDGPAGWLRRPLAPLRGIG
jgi:carboxyl-terminal processing protease